MRTIQQLARVAGISERQFHRRLNAGDNQACTLLKATIIQDRLPGMIVADLRELSGRIGRADPAMASKLHGLADQIWEWYDDREAQDLAARFRAEDEEEMSRTLSALNRE